MCTCISVGIYNFPESKKIGKLAKLIGLRVIGCLVLRDFQILKCQRNKVSDLSKHQKLQVFREGTGNEFGEIKESETMSNENGVKRDVWQEQAGTSDDNEYRIDRRNNTTISTNSNSDGESEIDETWQVLASNLNRLFSVLYIICNMISLIFFLWLLFYT